MSKKRKNQGKVTKGKLRKGRVITLSTTGAPPASAGVLPTTPYEIFRCSIQRAKNLIKVHGLAHGAQSRPPVFLADTHRAAIVLAVSALDAFVRTYVTDRIVRKVIDPTQTIPGKLRDMIKDYLGQDVILDAARHGDLSSRVEKAFKEQFQEQSFQGVKKISAVMQLVGTDDVFATIARSAAVNEETLKRDIARFTKRRHIIAHCGDYDLNQSPPKENKVLKKDALDCIRTVELVAREIHKL